MALTSFSFGRYGYNIGGGAIEALVVDADLETEGIASSATNQTTTAVAPGGGTALAACRVATDTTVYVSFGSAPDAGTDAGRVLLIANTSMVFMVPAGYKGAVKTP